MHVVAKIRNNPVVACDRVALEIAHQFRVRNVVGNTVSGVGIVSVGDVVEIDERIVSWHIVVGIHERTETAANVLVVRSPGNAGFLEQRDQMIGAALVAG